MKGRASFPVTSPRAAFTGATGRECPLGLRGSGLSARWAEGLPCETGSSEKALQ